VDKDPDFAVKKLEAFVDLWRTKVMERDATAIPSTRAITPVATSSGTLAVGSTESAAVVGQDTVPVTAAAAAAAGAAGVNKAAGPVIVVVPPAATPVDEEPTKVQKALRVMQSLYFPWLPMFVPPVGSKRYKAIKFAQALYLPWLPMFLPPKKQEA
jgi:hypothetical protein